LTVELAKGIMQQQIGLIINSRWLNEYRGATYRCEGCR